VFQNAYEAAVQYGVESMKACWEWWERTHTLPAPPELTPRKDPRDTDYDLHVNIVSWEGNPQVRDVS
jgi:hypothetical protein